MYSLNKWRIHILHLYKSQEFAAFRPFPGIFVTFFKIASLTSNYQIRDIIGGNISTSNARDRERMINMMFSPFDVISTIITFFMLSQVLFLNLLRCMGARNATFTGAIAPSSCILLLLVFASIMMCIPAMPFNMSYAVLPDHFKVMLTMCSVVNLPFREITTPSRNFGLLFMGGTIYCSCFLLADFTHGAQSTSSSGISSKVLKCRRFEFPTLGTLQHRYVYIRDIFMSLANQFTASFAGRAKTILPVFTYKEVLCGCRFPLFTFGTLYVAISIAGPRSSSGATLCMAAFLAFGSYSEWAIFVCMEVLDCCRFPSFTACALLLWGRIGYSVHDISPNQMYPALGCFQHRKGTTLLPHHYTTKQPPKPVCMLTSMLYERNVIHG